MQTLQITLKHLDRFAWIGAMSGPPRQGFDAKTSFEGVFNDAAGFNKKVKLFWVGRRHCRSCDSSKYDGHEGRIG